MTIMRFTVTSDRDTLYGDRVVALGRLRCILRALTANDNVKLGIPDGATRLGYAA